MNGTITGGGKTITPTIILMVSEESSGGNVITQIPGRADPDVTLRPASLRTGTIELGFAGAGSDASSAAAFTTLRAADTFVLAAPSRPTLNMRFVVQDGGRISRAIDPDTRNAWTVTVDFQEVGT